MGLFRSSAPQDSDLRELQLAESTELEEETPAGVSDSVSARSAGNKETVLGQGQVFEGTVKGEGAVRLEGTFKGDITLQGEVSISMSGVFNGTIEATNVFVFGAVDGNITAHGKVRLACGCKVKGDIRAESLAIEDGATFNGSSSMMTEDHFAKAGSALPPLETPHFNSGFSSDEE